MGIFQKLFSKTSIPVSLPPSTAIKSEIVASIPTTINTKIVGVTFGDIQEYLSECFHGQDLLIKNKPSDKYPHAMAVYTLRDDDDPTDYDKPRKTDKMIGYIQNELAKDLFEKSLSLGESNPYDASILEITGGTNEAPILGCNIMIVTI
jgi:hypothetical protein